MKKPNQFSLLGWLSGRGEKPLAMTHAQAERVARTIKNRNGRFLHAYVIAVPGADPAAAYGVRIGIPKHDGGVICTRWADEIATSTHRAEVICHQLTGA